MPKRNPKWIIADILEQDDEGFVEIADAIVEQSLSVEAKPKDGLIMLGEIEGDIDARVRNWGKFSGLSSGWASVDSITYGWEKGELIIFGGEPGVGKTFFTIQLAINISRLKGKPVLPTIVSMEISKEILASRTAVNHGENWRELNIILQEEQMIQRKDFAGIIKKAKEGGSDFIIVDYLQMLKDDSDNEHREISRIVRDLKQLALKYEVTIFAISSLNRSRDSEAGLQAKDLYGSGAIEFYADQIMFLEHGKGENEVEIKIIKNRSNPLNRQKQILKFNGKSFTEDWIQPVQKSIDSI